MPTPADIPKRRTGTWRDRVNPEPRPRRCPHFTCNIKIARSRFCCSGHWTQLPPDIRAALKATYPPPAGLGNLPADDPFRLASRAARDAWRATAKAAKRAATDTEEGPQ